MSSELVAIAIWYCDTCGETISNPGEAFLQWVVAEDDSIHDVRIVHELSSTPRERPLGCFIDDQQVRREGRGRVQDYGLEAYLGSDGLMYLLSMSEIGFPPKQIYELVRRLHVPGYETVRKHLPRAIERGVIDKNGFDSYYSELQIEKVQAWLESEPQ